MRQSENEAAKPVFRSSIDDWELLYYVWVDEAGRIECDARRRLVRYRELWMYDKKAIGKKAARSSTAGSASRYAAAGGIDDRSVSRCRRRVVSTLGDLSTDAETAGSRWP